MICESCKEKRHEDCRGGSWCDCQHQTDTRREPDDTGGQKPEPPMNWLRQG
ncbi:hypothetical protein [Nonomuraea sp. CA-141351]|uniref:hypothetical protein n=1 Tax=Nonomuraea sp. CA-141351 TaxID=3239996 RepID=UPI003D8E99E1